MKGLMELISLAARLFLAWLFIYASYDKIWDPAGFAQSVARYEVLPLILVNSASVFLAWVEMIIGLLLLAGVATRSSALWATLLLVVFTSLMLYAEYTGAGYDCGCFPGQAGRHAAGLEAALRDLAFLAPALWLLFKPGNWLILSFRLRRRRTSRISL
jgi:uncharacterized membrane protein YphA (DoxX/SURF4 family)